MTVFDRYAQEYDRWFDEHERIYQAEVSAVRQFIPPAGIGVEVGVGTGRFSIPFSIKLGVESSRRMAQFAHRGGILVCQAVGERLPFRDGQFDFVLMVTVICFVADVSELLRETCRVLKAAGRLIIGFIDRESALGQLYESRKETDQFYRQARFYSAAEVADYTRRAGFNRLEYCQTVFGVPIRTFQVDPVRTGYGKGAFVVLSAEKRGGG